MSSAFRRLATHLGAAGLSLGLAAAPAGAADPAQIALPSDASSDCTITQSEFNSWFAAGAAASNAAVDAADSETFAADSDICDFYKWGAQMFLWLTSPLEPSADPVDRKKIVLDGPAIVDVLPGVYDASTKQTLRTMELNGPNAGPTRMALRTQKQDEIGELGQAGSSGVLLSQNNSLVYYGVHVNDVYAYFATGYDPTAPSGYDAFRNMKDFPMDADAMAAIDAYMTSAYPGVKLDAEDAMVMEFKTSWVDAATVDAEKFVLMDALVPSYATVGGTNGMVTAPGPLETKTLALTGVHIVGTVKDHPEFVWATFEHIYNAPDNSFIYNTADGVGTYAYDPAGAFTFRADDVALSDANTECMIQLSRSQAAALGVPAGSIAAVDLLGDPVYRGEGKPAGTPACDGGMAPSDTVRDSPWGGLNLLATRASFEPTPKNTALNNARLITLNRDIIGYLTTADDVRRHYVQIGGIWTNNDSPRAIDGVAPIPYKTATTDDLRGSLRLYNSTMETYTYEGSPNCFSCHSLSDASKDSFVAFGLSHIFSELLPLPPETSD